MDGNVLSFIIGVSSGVIASFISWICVTRLIHPLIKVSDKILLMPSVYSENNLIAKIKVENNSMFDAFEFVLRGRIFLYNLVEGKPDMQTLFVVSVGSGSHPYLPNKRKGMKEETSGRLFRLTMKKNTKMKLAYLFDNLQPGQEPTLFDFLNMDTRNHIEVSVICSHGFSFARGIQTKKYFADDIVTGYFRNHGVEVDYLNCATNYGYELEFMIQDYDND